MSIGAKVFEVRLVVDNGNPDIIVKVAADAVEELGINAKDLSELLIPVREYIDEKILSWRVK